MNLQSNISLKHLNTFHIKTDAKYFYEVASIDELDKTIRDIEAKGLNQFILGGGSNILFRSEILEDVILKNNLQGIQMKEKKGHVLVTAASGVIWDDLVSLCVKHDWGGIENLSYIPGTVGAAPIQNIGAYGVEMKDHFYQLEAIKLASLKKEVFNKKNCHFEYRDSVFKNQMKGKYFITSVTFKLTKGDHSYKTDYTDVKDEIEKLGGIINLQNIRTAIINIRKRKLPEPDEIGNGGSFFKNPVIDQTQFDMLSVKYPKIPHFAQKDNSYKIPAAWLIDQAGWKNFRDGDAGVHKNHALVLVNYGAASGEEIFILSEKIIKDIQLKFDITLEREINVV